MTARICAKQGGAGFSVGGTLVPLARWRTERYNHALPETFQGLVQPEESEQILGLVLSKALLLADDKRIKDPTIARQLS